MPQPNASLFSLLVCITLLLSACETSGPPFVCNDPIGCVTVASGAPIKLGALQALSGDVAPIGIDQVRGIQLALAKKNNQLLGHPITLQTEDAQCSSEGGTIAAMKIVADPQIMATLGTSCSGAAITASKVISDAGLVMVSGLNTAPSLTVVDGQSGAHSQPGYFRSISNDETMIQAEAAFIYQELGVTKMATIDDGDLFTRSHAEALKRAFTKMGGEVVLAVTIDKGDTNMHPVLDAVSLSGAELLFIPLFQPEGIRLVQQSREVEGVQSTKILGADPLFAETFIDTVETAAAGMYFIARLAPETPAYYNLVSDYTAKFGELPNKHNFGFAYDAANILLNAIEKTAIQGKSGTLHIGRHALREALHSTADFDGIMGKLTCDAFGDCGAGSLNIVRFDDTAAGYAGLAANVIYTYTSNPLVQPEKSP